MRRPFGCIGAIGHKFRLEERSPCIRRARPIRRCRTWSCVLPPHRRCRGPFRPRALLVPRPSLLPVMNALPSGEVAKASSSGFGSVGCVIWIASPMRPNSQPTPVAPGPYSVPVFRKMCGVRECNPGPAGSIFRDVYVHPAYVSGELPCEGEV